MAKSAQISTDISASTLLYRYKEIRFFCKDCGPRKLYTREKTSRKSKDQPTLERHVLKMHPGQTLAELSDKYGHRFHYTDGSIRDLSFEQQKKNPQRILPNTRVHKKARTSRKRNNRTKGEEDSDETSRESTASTTTKMTADTTATTKTAHITSPVTARTITPVTPPATAEASSFSSLPALEFDLNNIKAQNERYESSSFQIEPYATYDTGEYAQPQNRSVGILDKNDILRLFEATNDIFPIDPRLFETTTLEAISHMHTKESGYD